MDNQETTQIQQVNQETQQNSLIPADVIESLVLNGDLSKMSGEQKVQFYNSICKSMGLNPMTQPFEIINLKGKLKMYAKKDGTDQLRRIYGVSVTKIETDDRAGVYMVTAYVKDKFGREDSDIGVVPVQNLQGEALANAIMKATTKAKRRATLSICGLGMLDESEVESIVASESVKTNSHQDDSNRINLDTVDPNNQAQVNDLEQMLNFIFNPIVPDSEFGGQSKEDFVQNFRNDLYAGVLTVEYATKVYNKILSHTK